MSAQKILFVLVPIVLLAMWAIPGTGDEKERLELKPVLLVIDVQNAYWPLMSEEDRNTAPEKINEVIALFREFAEGH